MKKINGIRIIKRGWHDKFGEKNEKLLAEKTLSSRQIQTSTADCVKDWVRDFKAKKKNEIAVARRFFVENTTAANSL